MPFLRLKKMKEYIAELVRRWEVDKSDRMIDEIGVAYYAQTGKKLKKRGCSLCADEAIFELKNLINNNQIMADKKFKLQDPNRLVYFQGGHYTGNTMTDEVAVKMVQSNRKNAGLFENPDGLLAEASRPAEPSKSKVVHVTENEAKTEPVATIEPASKVEVKTEAPAKVEPKAPVQHPKHQGKKGRPKGR